MTAHSREQHMAKRHQSFHKWVYLLHCLLISQVHRRSWVTLSHVTARTQIHASSSHWLRVLVGTQVPVWLSMSSRWSTCSGQLPLNLPHCFPSFLYSSSCLSSLPFPLPSLFPCYSPFPPKSVLFGSFRQTCLIALWPWKKLNLSELPSPLCKVGLSNSVGQ